MKIKGWNLIEDMDFWKEYHNSRTGRRLIISRIGMSSIWFVSVENKISQKEFSQKQFALDYAYQWMRTDPYDFRN